MAQIIWHENFCFNLENFCYAYEKEDDPKKTIIVFNHGMMPIDAPYEEFKKFLADQVKRYYETDLKTRGAMQQHMMETMEKIVHGGPA